MRRRALITGITGQDGSYLAEYLLARGYEVHGIVRRTSLTMRQRIDHLQPYRRGDDMRLHVHYGDLGDGSSLVKLLYKVRPHEIYNLAAQSHVRVSFDVPEYTGDITAIGAARLLNAVVETDMVDDLRFYQASSSEMFGLVRETPQTETTPFYPRSPYACAKAYAHYLTVNYREAYGLHASCGILFNHESPRRGESFVTRKISAAAARIKLGLQDKLYLGNLDAKRDWGYAPEYVVGMWQMLQQDEPADYLLATNHTQSVREFLDACFDCVGLNWQDYVEFDPLYTRPSEVDLLIGNPAKANAAFGWEPTVRMADLAKIMVNADLRLLQTHPADARTGAPVVADPNPEIFRNYL